MTDLLFKTSDFVFSYRVAGICVQNGMVLLQRPGNDSGFAFPGGHAAWGETNEQTLVREFKEELGAGITVGELKWVAEIFFPWGGKPCHQICLYYLVDLLPGSPIPRTGQFFGRGQLEGRHFHLEFHWVPLKDAEQLEIYPTNAAQLLGRLDQGVQHFVYREL